MNAPLKNHFLADNMVLKNASWKSMIITAKILSFLGGTKMKQRRTTWKAIVAVILVMVTLFSISMAVSAGFVEKVFAFGEACELMSSGTTTTCEHVSDGGVKNYTWTCPHGGCIYRVVTHCTKCGAWIGAIGFSKGCPKNICQRP